MLLNHDGSVWVGRRNDLQTDEWQMPQGGIKKGEKPVEAGLREMEEEIGTRRATLLHKSRYWRAYDLPGTIARRMWKGAYRGQTQRWVAYRFEGTDADIDIATEHREFNAWRWADPDRLADLVVPFKRDIYVSVVDEFRHLWAE